ncbi:sensor histidine kinase [Kocuria sediminis]|uniref:Sensor histidine kinase n=1 Tax=Kocuria sediminis TaxID=1038857 RepID=A0A6N8GQI3_9MICC|nr:ATP-binding protein [Kocuria sediminis]MUN63215.1 sensor histidine kinase [Kocuria sediminis]
MRRTLPRGGRTAPEVETLFPSWPVTAPESLSRHSEVRGAIARFLLAGLVVLLVTALPAAWWIRSVAEEHAVDHVLRTTQRLTSYAVAPLITDDLLSGGTADAAQLDKRLQPWLQDGTIHRIKIWDEDGTILYSDERSLVGQNFGPPPWDADLVARGEGVATIEHQEGSENTHESRAGQLVEVYVGFVPASGEQLVFEAYYDDAIVREEERSVLLSMAPALLLTLVLFQLAQLGPAIGLARRIQDQRATRARLLQHAVDAAELERVRVARDLHDDVIQDLAGLSYALEAQEMQAAPEQRGMLGRTRSILQGSLRTLRGITTALYSPDLLTLGLPKAMTNLAEPLAQRGVDTSVQIDPAVFLTPEQEGMFLKVAREALANISKHAHASTVTVHLGVEHGATVMTISDDGTGFDDSRSSPEGHLGLRIMRDIADAAGAELSIRSRPGVGTTVLTTLPHDAVTVRL